MVGAGQNKNLKPIQYTSLTLHHQGWTLLPGTIVWLPKLFTIRIKTPKQTNSKVKELHSFMTALEIHVIYCGNLHLFGVNILSTFGSR